LQIFFKLMPVWFGLGFLAPLIAQTLIHTGLAGVLPVSPLIFGLVVGGGWGAVAVKTGRWI